MKAERTAKVIITLVLALMFSATAVASEIYQWVDENGIQHFSQYPPIDETLNVSQRTLEDTSPAGDGQAEDIFHVEEHAKRMAEWREERDKKRKESRERKRLAEQQQVIRYPQPESTYPRSFWHLPAYGRPPYRPPHKPPPKPELPIEKPRPPSVVRPRG